MSRAAPRARRAGQGPLSRGALALALVAIGYLAVTQSLALALAERAPELAYRLAPGNGRVAAGYARQLLDSDPAANQADAAALAQEALRREPTAVSAAATLGLIAQLGDDAARAGRWFGYAARLSRRDLPTELWQIEHAVGEGDIPGALRHYDIALRTQPGASEILFPVLAGASADPAIAAALIRTLRGAPAWSDGFLSYLAANTKAPEASAQLFARLATAGVPVATASRNALVDKLLGSNIEAAWTFYRSFHPGADRRRSRDPDFTGAGEAPSALDWVAINDVGLSGAVQRGADHGVFSFSTAPTVGGVLLRQRQLLPPGRYVIEGESADLAPAAGDQPYWSLSCLADGRELGRVDVPPSARQAGRFSGMVNVPADCPVQLLAFTARASDAVDGVSGQLNRALLRPAP